MPMDRRINQSATAMMGWWHQEIKQRRPLIYSFNNHSAEQLRTKKMIF